MEKAKRKHAPAHIYISPKQLSLEAFKSSPWRGSATRALLVKGKKSNGSSLVTKWLITANDGQLTFPLFSFLRNNIMQLFYS